MAFTASEIPDVLTRLDNVMPGSTAYKAERTFPTPLLDAMLDMQTVSAIPTFQEGRCIAVDAAFLEVGQSTTTAAAYDPTAQGCDLLDGPEASTRKKTFTNGVIAIASHKITAPKCANAVTRNEEMAVLMRKAFADIRKVAQREYLDLFTTNVQADVSGGEGFGTATSGGNRLAVDPAEWNFELLRRIELLAAANQFPERKLIANGQNLWLDADLATFRALNDDKRDQAAIFGESNIVWDYRMQDAYLGRNSTFVVNPDQFIFHNTSFYPPEGMTKVINGKQRTLFSVADPELSFRLDGRLVPVRYHVEVEETCVGRTAMDEPIMEILVNVKLLGLIDIAPAGYTNPALIADAPAVALTGVLEIVRETPAA
jgi:hypothetical protein